MHIAVYLDSLAAGGAQRASLNLIRSLVDEQVRVTLLLHQDYGELGHLVPPEIEVIAFNTSRTTADLPPLMRFLRQASPDILLVALHHNSMVALVAKLITRVSTKVIVAQHNALSAEAEKGASWKYRVLPILYRLFNPLIAAIVAVSDGVAEDVAVTCRFPRERVITIYNPVVTRELDEQLGEPTQHPWFRDKTIPVFVAAARLVEQKDYPTLLRAFALHRRHRKGRLFIMGTGSLQPMLAVLANKLNVSDDVCFAGYIANPLPYMRAATAFVLSSRFEGFGIVIVEALACGTPVISTDCPFGPSEVLDHGRYGYLIPVGDSDALAVALGTDLRAMWPREVLRNRAEQFSAKRSCENYIALFNRLLA